MNDKVEFEAFIERVRAESDLIAVISDYVALKKKGKNYWGCCPFHNEKTPSFSVNADKGFFYCFGCHVGGDAIKFIAQIESLSRWEAIKFLADKLHIPLPQREKTPQDLEREREFSRMREVYKMAGNFFFSCLNKTNYGRPGRAYFQKRGVSDEAVAQFQLGFAPDAWDKLAEAFIKRGYSEAFLVKAGLALEKNSGGIYDRFRNRIMFPICDTGGHVCGFGGRVLDDSQPKYLNSPETIIFNKRKILFGLHLAYKEMKKQSRAIIVEGYMDAVTAHSHGIQNVVASLGTAFTPEQCKLLLRYANEIIFAYDSDSAGQKATLRALSIVRSFGAQIRVLSIPDGKDPDEFIRKHGGEAFLALADAAIPLLDYQFQQAMANHDSFTLEGKVGIVADLLPLLSDMENAVELSAYIAKIAQALNVDEQAIRAEIRKFSSQNKKDKNVKSGQAIKTSTMVHKIDNAVVHAGRHMIRLLWDDTSIIPYVEAQLPMEAFQKKEHREIMEFLIDSAKSGIQLNSAAASAQLSDAANCELSRALCMEQEQMDSLQLIEDCIKNVYLSFLNEKYRRHCQKAEELERRGDAGFLQELAESQRIKKEIDKIHE